MSHLFIYILSWRVSTITDSFPCLHGTQGSKGQSPSFPRFDRYFGNIFGFFSEDFFVFDSTFDIFFHGIQFADDILDGREARFLSIDKVRLFSCLAFAMALMPLHTNCIDNLMIVCNFVLASQHQHFCPIYVIALVLKGFADFSFLCRYLVFCSIYKKYCFNVLKRQSTNQ